MNDPDDPLPAMRAQLDQAIAMMPDLARTARAYYDAFQGEGFTEKQSIYLTATQMVQAPGTAP